MCCLISRWWHPCNSPDSLHIIQCDEGMNTGAVSFQSIARANWTRIRAAQFFIAPSDQADMYDDDPMLKVEDEGDANSSPCDRDEQTDAAMNDGDVSTIAEVDEDSLSEFFCFEKSTDSELQAARREASSAVSVYLM